MQEEGGRVGKASLAFLPSFPSECTRTWNSSVPVHLYPGWDGGRIKEKNKKQEVGVTAWEKREGGERGEKDVP